MTGRSADTIGYLGVIDSSSSKKRTAAFRGLEDKEIENGGLLNGIERTRTTKSRRRLPDSEESTQQTQIPDYYATDTHGSTTSSKPPHRRHGASRTRRDAYLAASAKIKEDSRRADLSHIFYSRESSPDTEAFSSFHTTHPHSLPSPLTSTGLPPPLPTTDLPPPLTSTIESNRSNANVVIVSDDSDSGEEEQREQPTTASLHTSTKKDRGSVTQIARSFEDVKMEPLTDDMMKQTMFLVTVHDSPIGPVPVPFTECGSFHILFPTLTEERGVANEDARKVDNITTVFTWTGGELGGRVGGIRRNKPGDWIYFCETLRKAHERDADRFNGKCEVAIKLHINNKHKEHC